MMGVPIPRFKHFPLGLGGLYAGDVFGLPDNVKEEEDRAQEFVDTNKEGYLALVYKLLYARGFRIGTVQPQIEAWKKSLIKPLP
jgi:hypothetical protein